MIPEKYSSPPQAPLTFCATVESIFEDNKRLCDNTKAVLDELVATITPKGATFDNVLRPLAQDEDERQLVSSVLGLYLKVSTDPAVREASAQAEIARSNFMIDCGMREDVFRLVDSVFQKNEATVDPESRKLLVEERRNYVRNGLALSSQSGRDRLKEIQKRLTTIRTEFAKNLDEEEEAIWFTPEELAGVPEDVLIGLDRGTGELEGKLKVTLKQTDIDPLMQFAVSSETRRETFIRSINKVHILPVYLRPTLTIG
jgi:metallopeptidase MepB